jgi:RNA polymerase sigma-70 factor (ECF subfamily)
LPASQRDALNLVVYSELPQKQAAEVMDISLKAIESLLVRAKKSLKTNIKRARSAETLPRSAALD